MPNSIALTRIHTPEDYWNRMAQAEDQLHISVLILDMKGQYFAAKLCRIKAQQLSDRYHEHWTTTRKDYFG